MLEHLQWEPFETRRSKIQLTLLYKVVQDLVDIPAADYLTAVTVKTRAMHARMFRQFSTSTESLNFFSSDYIFMELYTSFCSWDSFTGTVQEGAFHPLIISKITVAVTYWLFKWEAVLSGPYVLWHCHKRQIGLCLLSQRWLGIFSSFFAVYLVSLCLFIYNVFVVLNSDYFYSKL